ncbi:probable membrane-associated kinase regulator 4 [Neltuma alba]|uniref:probable membrane-associated kinase regulator 4 n=1 Tax=Neltuma alba TaxID=207710 RepID=UPI0010A31604|nr:probable membrane-associated kinase regulator 4 [Prosopis alba]
MAAKLLLPADGEDEFIDMEISSLSNFLLSHTSPSPNPNSSEFEFQMSSSSSSSSIFQHSEASSTSPADELFYKGKLLPLHLPPRLQMVQQILQNQQDHSYLSVSSDSVNDYISNRSPINSQKDYGFDDFYSSPLTTSYSTPVTVTPFESPKVSLHESFRVTGHEMLNPEEEDRDFVDTAEKNQKKMMMKKKKQFFSMGSKLKAWFGKISCKYESAYVTKKVADEGSASRSRESNNLNHKQNGKVVMGKKYPFGQIIQRSDRERFQSFSSRIEFRSIDIDTDQDGGKCENYGSNRITRSSLVANNKLCFNGSSSFSGLPTSKCMHGSCQELEIGNLIMGAIAHCKQSHQQYFK